MDTHGPYFLGIDVGSLSCDAALIDQQDNLLSLTVLPTGVSGAATADQALENVLHQAGIHRSAIGYTVSTGYGRERVTYAHKNITEITCHGLGAHYFFQDTDYVLDIGGQDSKAIKVDQRGRVVDFAMNDRCAAGTGRFLEVMARALELELDELGPLSLASSGSCPISSICTVFAKSEVVSLLAQGTPVDQIVRGLHDAVARRTLGLLQRINPLPGRVITMSGGVTLNQGVVKAIEELAGTELHVPPHPQLVGAIGAAILAKEHYRSDTDQ